MPATPADPLSTTLLFEAGLFAVATVLGMTVNRLRATRGGGGRGMALVPVMLALGLLVYAGKHLPATPALWLVLGPATVFFVVIGWYAGAGRTATRVPSMEEQIATLTGEADVDWDTLRPNRGLDHLRDTRRHRD
jgi:hypothetical protein